MSEQHRKMEQTAAQPFSGPIGACGARRWDRPSPSSRKRSVAGRAIDDGPASAYYLSTTRQT